MASNYTNLGVQLMTTGEKAGTWGTLTNTNWNMMEQIAGGYVTQALTDNGTVTLVKSDGSTGAVMATRVIKLTGTLSVGNAIVTVPDSIENWWIVNNAEGGSTYTVTFKTVSGTGVAWAAGETGAKLIYTDGTNCIDASADFGSVTASSTTTFTNKTLTAPKFADGGFIADTTGAETLVFGEVSSPLNEVKITNAATGTAGPIIAAQGQTNVNLQLRPAGSGMITTGTAAAHSFISSNGAYNLVLETNEGTNAGTVTLEDGANGEITLTPNGTGVVAVEGSMNPSVSSTGKAMVLGF